MATDTSETPLFEFPIALPDLHPQQWIAILRAIGLVSGGVLLLEIFLVTTVVSPPDGFFMGVITGTVLVAGLLYGSRWLRRSDLSPVRYQRITSWTLLGGSVFTILITSINLFVQPFTAFLVLTTARWAGTLGAVLGLLAGTKEAQAIESEVARERALVRTQELEKRKELLRFLNELLRHEVLNTATAIDNYVELLEREHDLDDETADYLDRIKRQSDSMSTVISDVQILVQTLDRPANPTPTNLCEILDAEIQSLRERYPDAQIDCHCPDELFVVADTPIARVFANLLENAVYHNDADDPHVDVSVSVSPDTVSVEVADNGPGVLDDQRDRLFEPTLSMGADHGLGLYLSRTLVEQYDGTIRLQETSPAGTVFRVRLPRASRPNES